MECALAKNRDETAKIEEMPGSTSLSWASTNSEDIFESLRGFPRIGDEYQVNVPLYIPHLDCYEMAVTKSMNDEKDADIMWRFEEGLALEVMQIPCFHPLVGAKDYEMTHASGSISNKGPATNEFLVSVEVETNSGLYQKDLFQSADDGFAHELGDSYQLSEKKAHSSTTNLKTEILRAEDTCTESTITAENVPDAFCSHRGKQRKRSRIGWKKVKKIKAALLDSSIQTHHPRRLNIENNGNSRGYIIVSGSPSALWHKSEEDLFLLGLYIFGKNFNAVKRFVETKEMGDILAYYYGVFFRTGLYCRWTESRKTRNRKCIQGYRIFSEWRQRELLTRLLPHTPQHSKHEVPEITNAFNEGRNSLEEFVTKLKALVGPEVLFQAVGIGQGKEDLTSALIEPAKMNQGLSSRRDIPIGRACSSLSTEDIIQFLTGNFRLSKARADDLFWEAVWPRLLARGWQSEQPDDQLLFGIRQSLVFLIPGVHKFSRRNLTKGIHYFDSVSEVLSRVASDPRLLELDSDETRGDEGKPEFPWVSEDTDVQIGHGQHSQSYLQPRTCKNISDPLMFTVVDTSMISQGDQSHRILARVTLPLDDEFEKFETTSSETEDGDSLPSQLNEQQCCHHFIEQDLLNHNMEESVDILIDSAEKTRNFGIHRESTLDQNDVLSSPSKKRRLSICNEFENDTVDASLIQSRGSKVNKIMLNFNSKEASKASLGKSIPITHDNYEIIGTTLLSEDSLSANNISNTSQNPGQSRLMPEMGLGLKSLQDQTESTAMNSALATGCELMKDSRSEVNSLYESSSEFSNEEPNKKSEVAQACSTSPEDNQLAGSQQNNATALLENASNVRRQSTRVRPLTARALEAFASGFFTPKRRKKGGEKTVSSDGYRTKSLSSLVHDELSSSFNPCRSDC